MVVAYTQITVGVKRIFGFDPGLKRVGLACVEVNEDEPSRMVVREAFVIATEKSKNRRVAATDDDVRRMQIIWSAIDGCWESWGAPDFIGVEAYAVRSTPKGGAGKGVGWKAIYAYAMVCGASFAHGVSPVAYVPQQVKSAASGARTADKQDVERGVIAATSGASKWLDLVPHADREHAADAIAVAMCRWQDYLSRPKA